MLHPHELKAFRCENTTTGTYVGVPIAFSVNVSRTKLLHHFSTVIFGEWATRLDVTGQIATRTELKH
jgi:hypothetical protein